MRVVQLKHPLPSVCFFEKKPCVVALGFFDGVHLGHQHILQKAKEIAKHRHLEFSVMTFYPHPREVIHADGKPFPYLSPLSLKIERFVKLGVERLYIVEFDPAFSRLSAKDFVHQYLVGLACQHVVAGFDFTYGYKGEGTMSQLAEIGRGAFAVTTISKIEHNLQKISSTLIRQIITSGEVNQIPAYLGDYYEVRGRASRDQQQIRIAVDPCQMLPKPGVYRIRANISQQTYEGICHQVLPVLGKQNYLEIQLFNCTKQLSDTPIQLKWINRIPFEYRRFVGDESHPYLIPHSLYRNVGIPTLH